MSLVAEGRLLFGRRDNRNAEVFINSSKRARVACTVMTKLLRRSRGPDVSQGSPRTLGLGCPQIEAGGTAGKPSRGGHRAHCGGT